VKHLPGRLRLRSGGPRRRPKAQTRRRIKISQNGQIGISAFFRRQLIALRPNRRAAVKTFHREGSLVILAPSNVAPSSHKRSDPCSHSPMSFLRWSVAKSDSRCSRLSGEHQNTSILSPGWADGENVVMHIDLRIMVDRKTADLRNTVRMRRVRFQKTSPESPMVNKSVFETI
jgi:hypothetical protein